MYVCMWVWKWIFTDHTQYRIGKMKKLKKETKQQAS